MGEVKPARLARGKRVIEVKPVEYARDPRSVGSITLTLGSGGNATALIDEAERVLLIEALGGRDTYDPELADRLENNNG